MSAAHTPKPWWEGKETATMADFERLKRDALELMEAAKLAEAWESGKDVGPMTSDEVVRRIRSAIAKVEVRP